MTIHGNYIIFGCLLYFTNWQRPPIVAAKRGSKIFEYNGDACFPSRVLYSENSDQLNFKELDGELNALDFLTNANKWKLDPKNAVSSSGKIAVLGMHSWTSSLKPLYDKKYKKLDGSLI